MIGTTQHGYLQLVKQPVTQIWTAHVYSPSSRLGHLLDALTGRGGDESETLSGEPMTGVAQLVERQKHRLHSLALSVRDASGRLSTCNREVIGSNPIPGPYVLRDEPLGTMRRTTTPSIATSLTRRLRGSSVSPWDDVVGYLVNLVRFQTKWYHITTLQPNCKPGPKAHSLSPAAPPVGTIDSVIYTDNVKWGQPQTKSPSLHLDRPIYQDCDGTTALGYLHPPAPGDTVIGPRPQSDYWTDLPLTGRI